MRVTLGHDMLGFRTIFLIFLSTLASFGQIPPATPKYGSLTPVFEENRGQVSEKSRFFLRDGSLDLFITNTGAVWSLKKGNSRAAVRLEVAGASGNGVAVGESPAPGHVNYLMGKDSSKWVTGVPQFKKVRVREVRNGVDLIYYASKNELEYDLVVKPGTPAADIKLRFAGANKVSLTEQGEIKIETAVGNLIQHKPTIYQLSGEEREPIDGRYNISKSGEISLTLGRYDRTREVVIDPVVSYATYLGGSSNDQGYAIVVDASGNAYITGATNSADFPTTVGAYSVAEKAGNTSIFVTKLNSTGTALIYSTYLGGSYNSVGSAIAVDTSGNAFITGSTQSIDFPVTTGAFQTANKNYQMSAFVTKLNASGTALIYSTYLGGSYSQSAAGIQIDSTGNAYVAGNTSSSDFPVTSGAYRTTIPGGPSAFVTKLNSSGSQLVYSTYLGGNGYDAANGIALDSALNAYVTGYTQSVNFPTTTGAFQTAASAGVGQNGFIAKLSADGASLVASTYLGGTLSAAYGSYNANSIMSAIALDSSNAPYVTGYTYSSAFPTTPGAFSTVASTIYYGTHAFVTKMNSALTALTYSSYLSGSASDTGNAIAVDSVGHAYVAGHTMSPDFPITPGSLFGQSGVAAQSAFVTQMDPTGGTLNYSTLMGGTGGDSVSGVAVDGGKGVYLTGITTGNNTGNNFPVTAGAYQTTNLGVIYNHAYVAKLDLNSQVSCTLSISPSNYVAPLGGGTSSFAIVVPAGCPWVASNSSGNWVNLTGPSSGYGNATISYSVASGASTTAGLSTSIVVGAAKFLITQPAGSCSTPILAPVSASFGTAGGLDQFSISIPTGCLSNAVSSAPWLTITSGAIGSASRQVNFFVDRNDFATRSASISIAGTNYPVTQTGAGCSASATVAASVSNAGGSGVISLSTSATSCVWNAYALSPWIQLANTSGTGSATVGIILAPNPGVAARVGQVQIAGQVVSVSQAAGPVGTPQAYMISTIAGNGTQGFSGDGGPATRAQLHAPAGLAYDANGNLFIADQQNHRVRMVSPAGVMTTVVGTGVASDTGNGGPATSAGTYSPTSLVIGSSGDLYIGGPSRTVRKVTNGVITAFASLVNADSLAVDSVNNVYAAGSGFVRKITPSGVVSVIAGSGTISFSGDGGPAGTAAVGNYIGGLGLDTAGNLYLSDSINTRIRRIAGTVITTVAGTGAYSFNGDGPALTSNLSEPAGLAVDLLGNVFVADLEAYRVRRFTPGGNISTIAGNGYYGYYGSSIGDGGPALSATLSSPGLGLAIDPFGNIAFSDGLNVRLLTPTYTSCTYALSASSGVSPISGSTLTPTITTSANCGWNAYSLASWITISTASGGGPGNVGLVVAANGTGASRTGTVNIGGQTFTVTQQGVISIPATNSVTPSSSTGLSQTFTAVYSNSSGAIYLNRRLFLINSAVNASSACFVQADPSGTYLINDTDSALLGPLTATGSLSNSQCTLNGPGTSVINTGVTSTLTLSLTFKPAFTGAKSIFLYADDLFGNNSNWQLLGTFSILSTPSVPAAVSVSPASSTGLSQTFTAIYSDTAGVIFLNRRLFLINSAVIGSSGCFVQVDPTGIYLVNDADSALLGPLTATGTYTNSQCTLNGTGTTVVNSGITSTVTLALTFKNAFVGAKSIFLYTDDIFGNSGNWQSLASFSILSTPSVPTTVSVSPASSAGLNQTFTAIYSNAAGANFLNRRLFLINSGLNASGACFVQVDPTGTYLVNDVDSALLGPLTPYSSLSNSQCTLNGFGTTVSSSGATSTINLSLSFRTAFLGAKSIFMYTDDVFGNNSNWQLRGSSSVLAISSIPTAVSVSPSSGAGISQTFTAVFSDGVGTAYLNRRMILINSVISGSAACLVQIDPSGTYLANDADSALVGPLTSTSSLSNNQCTLSGSGTTLLNSGILSTATLSLTFKPAFAGPKSIFMYTDDAFGNNSNWQMQGSFSVLATPSVPSAISVSPASGSGLSQIFTAIYSNPAGASFLNRRLFLINSTLSGSGGCFVQADATGIYLVNNLDSALLGPLSGASNLSNSQCTLSGAGTSFVNSGSTSTLIVSLTFTNSFVGAKSIYMYTDDLFSNNGNWQLLGSFAP